MIPAGSTDLIYMGHSQHPSGSILGNVHHIEFIDNKTPNLKWFAMAYLVSFQHQSVWRGIKLGVYKFSVSGINQGLLFIRR